MHLADALQEARSAAFELLTKMVEDASPVVSPPPPIKKTDTTNTRRGIGVKEALELFDSIKKALESNPDLTLDIDWRIYHKDETSQ